MVTTVPRRRTMSKAWSHAAWLAAISTTKSAPLPLRQVQHLCDRVLALDVDHGGTGVLAGELQPRRRPGR